MNGTTKTHHFAEINVSTELQPNGEFSAIDADNYDLGSPMGWGFSRLEAIADLFEKMPRVEAEEFDHQAARFDHARDLRKNEVA